jgi:NDP-sugar pyrophosphorylase family protein
MQAVVLAGGLGTRLRPLTETIPKALIPVAGRPFIEYQIDQFRRYDVTDLIICVGHLGHMIEEHLGDGHRFDVSIRYGYERDGLLGTAGAIKNVEPLLEDAFFVQYGDSYLPVDYRDVMASFRRHDAPGLMVVYRNDDRWDRSNVVIDGGLVRVYDKTQKLPGMVYIDFGLSVFRRESFAIVPTSVATDLSVVHQSLIVKRQLLAYETRHRFYEVGSPEGLREFEALVQSGAIRTSRTDYRLSTIDYRSSDPI